MARCLIALGSNLGDRRRMLDWAVERLGQTGQIKVGARSRWHETAPVGGPPDQGMYLNGAVVVETSLRPEALLGLLQQLENEQGRRREARWGARALDLDLLLYDQQVLETATLTIPHPRMAWRRFVLEPAAEVAAEMVHPTTGWTIGKLLEHLKTAIPYVAITGMPGMGKTALAERLAQTSGGQRIAAAPSLPSRKEGPADSSSIAWQRELEFLEERTRLLAAEGPRWPAGGPWISDFWFGQSLAYAAVCLPPELWEAFRQRWEDARLRVVPPKLIVLLDCPPETIADRGGREASCGPARQESRARAIREAILAQATAVGQGPLLRLTDGVSDRSLAEIEAALIGVAETERQ